MNNFVKSLRLCNGSYFFANLTYFIIIKLPNKLENSQQKIKAIKVVQINRKFFQINVTTTNPMLTPIILTKPSNYSKNSDKKSEPPN